MRAELKCMAANNRHGASKGTSILMREDSSLVCSNKAVKGRSEGPGYVGPCTLIASQRERQEGRYQAEGGHVSDGLREEGLEVWKGMLLEQ